MYKIVNIKPGDRDPKKYRGRLLYAELREYDELVCSATLDYVLKTYYHKAGEIQNYKEALIKYIDFNNELILYI